MYRGAAVALVISYASQAIILIAYMKIRKLHEKTWGGNIISITVNSQHNPTTLGIEPNVV